MNSMNRLAETLLQHHATAGAKLFLVTSGFPEERVTECARELVGRLSDLHEGKIFLFAPDADAAAEHSVPMDMQRADFLDQLKDTYSMVILAVPDLLQEGGALPFLGPADAAVLVVRAASTRRADVRECGAQIEAAGLPLLGAVLTDTQDTVPRWVRRYLPGALR